VGGPRVPPIPESGDLSEFVKGMWATPMGDFTETFNLNVTAVLYTALAFLELLDAGNKKGNLDKAVKSQVIATGSVAAFSRFRGASFAYNTSKAATTHLMKMLSTYLAPWSIRSNVIAPGLFPSDLAQPIIQANAVGTDGDRPSFPKSFVPAERMGNEDEMGGTILYLASKAGAYCNGLVLLVDGGRVGVLQATY